MIPPLNTNCREQGVWVGNSCLDGTRLMTCIQRLLDHEKVNECNGDLSTVSTDGIAFAMSQGGHETISPNCTSVMPPIRLALLIA